MRARKNSQSGEDIYPPPEGRLEVGGGDIVATGGDVEGLEDFLAEAASLPKLKKFFLHLQTFF